MSRRLPPKGGSHMWLPASAGKAADDRRLECAPEWTSCESRAGPCDAERSHELSRSGPGARSRAAAVRGDPGVRQQHVLLVHTAGGRFRHPGQPGCRSRGPVGSHAPGRALHPRPGALRAPAGADDPCRPSRGSVRSPLQRVAAPVGQPRGGVHEDTYAERAQHGSGTHHGAGPGRTHRGASRTRASARCCDLRDRRVHLYE